MCTYSFVTFLCARGVLNHCGLVSCCPLEGGEHDSSGLLILLFSGISVRSANVWCFETFWGMSSGFCLFATAGYQTCLCTLVKDLLNVSRQQSTFVKNQIEWKTCLFCGGQFGLSNGSNVLPPMFMFPPRTCPVPLVTCYFCLAYP